MPDAREHPVGELRHVPADLLRDIPACLVSNGSSGRQPPSGTPPSAGASQVGTAVQDAVVGIPM